MPDPFTTNLDVALRERGISTIQAAKLCGATRQAVRMWRMGQRRPSVPYAKLLALQYGIPRHLIRPDLWDPPPEAAPPRPRGRPRKLALSPPAATA
jgi:transcriptional regulator with XRE-family HTH domain